MTATASHIPTIRSHWLVGGEDTGGIEGGRDDTGFPPESGCCGIVTILF